MAEERIKVEVINDVIIVEDTQSDRFIKAEARMEYGFRKKIENLRAPKKITSNGHGNNFTMELDEYDSRKDPDLLILAKQIVEWSSDKAITFTNIQQDKELGDLFDKVLLEVRKANNMAVKDEVEEKKD
jgi:hypothetical protein